MCRGIGSTRLWQDARGRCAGAAADDEEPVRGAALWPAVGGIEPARDRGAGWRAMRRGSITGAAAGAALDTGGCQRAAAGCGVRRAVGHDDEAGPSRPAPQAGRDHLSDRCHERAAERAQRRLGAVLGRGLRRQGARRSTMPMPIARSMPRSPRRTSTTSPRPSTCRSRPAPPMSSISAITIMPGGPSSTRPAAGSSPGSRPTRRSRWCEELPVPKAAPSCPTASAFCPRGRPRTAAIRCRTRCARSGS